MTKHKEPWFIRWHPFWTLCVYAFITLCTVLVCMYIEHKIIEGYSVAAPQNPKTEISVPDWHLNKYVYEVHKISQQNEINKILEEYNERYKYFNVYDIPLSDELQKYIYDLCLEYGIENQYDTIIALIWHESNFSSQVISPTNDYGLMQINKINHARLSATLGISNFLNPYENVSAGIYMLADLYSNYESTNLVLMSYNFGEGKARQLWSNGIYSSQYYRDIMDKRELLSL